MHKRHWLSAVPLATVVIAGFLWGAPGIATAQGTTPSATSISANNPTVVVGQAVTYTATVTGSDGGTPTGTVTFTGDAGTLCGGPVTLSDTPPDTATCSLTYSSSGGDSVTATYNGDTNYATSSAEASETINEASTSTTVSASPDSGPAPQTVTFTATVTTQGPGAGAPTGTVAFFSHGSFNCGPSATLNQQTPDQATCTVSYTVATDETVTAVYSGDGNFTGSGGTTSVDITPQGTSTSISANNADVVVGQPVSYTATVTGSDGGTPTGTVTFTGDAGTLCGGPVTLSDTSPDTATCAVTYSSAGNDTVTATYNANSSYAASSSSMTEEIWQAATTTSVTASPSSGVVPQNVTFTVTVAAVSPGAGTPTGTVTLSGSVSGPLTCSSPATLNQGTPDQATCTVSYTEATDETVTATYPGDSNFLGSSGTTNVDISPQATSTTITASADPIVDGQSVTYTATVTAAGTGSGNPTGTVTFSDSVHPSILSCAGGNTVGVSTSGGVTTATCTTSYAASGSDYVTATYNGDRNHDSSASSPWHETINLAGSSTTVALSSGSEAETGEPVTFTATVSAAPPSSGTPSGTVTFTVVNSANHSVACTGSGTLNQQSPDQASCTVSGADVAVSRSPLQVTATYSGNPGIYAGSTGSLSQTISPGPVNVSLTLPTSPAAPNRTVKLQVDVTPAGAYNATRTGTATFVITGSNGSTVSCTAANNSVTVSSSGKGTCDIPANTLTSADNAYSVNVTYNGNTNYQSGSQSGSFDVS
jgi:large repetitive protein